MHTFRVWGPRAKRVSVVVDGERYAMEREPGDWWVVTVNEARAGSRYGFLLDEDETPVPDPRSARQPYGVHGLSELVDHATFSWKDDDWRPPTLASGVIYELHVGTFTPEGTLDAAISRINYLRDLGITHIGLMPLAAAEDYRRAIRGAKMVVFEQCGHRPEIEKSAEFIRAAESFLE